MRGMYADVFFRPLVHFAARVPSLRGGTDAQLDSDYSESAAQIEQFLDPFLFVRFSVVGGCVGLEDWRLGTRESSGAYSGSLAR